MTIAVGQHTASANLSSQSAPFTSSALTTSASGSSFLIGLIVNAGSPPTGLSVSDSKSNSYSIIGTSSTGFGGSAFALYQCTNGTGGASHTASISWTGASILPGIFFAEITGAVTSGLVDQISSAQWNDDTATPFTSNATSTTTQADELAVAFTVTGSNSGTEALNWTANGYTQIDALSNANTVTGGMAYKLLTATGTQQVSFTSSGAGTTECATMLVTLKAAVLAGLTAASGTYTYTGQSAVLGQSLALGFGTYAITGSAATLTVNTGATTLLANAGSYALTGASSTSDLETPLAFGSYGVTGQAATLASGGGSTLALAFGSYGLTGSAATLVQSGATVMTADSGTYAITGFAATLTQAQNNFFLSSNFGTYSLNGQQANLVGPPVIGQGAPMLSMFKGALKKR